MSSTNIGATAVGAELIANAPGDDITLKKADNHCGLERVLEHRGRAVTGEGRHQRRADADDHG